MRNMKNVDKKIIQYINFVALMIPKTISLIKSLFHTFSRLSWINPQQGLHYNAPFTTSPPPSLLLWLYRSYRCCYGFTDLIAVVMDLPTLSLLLWLCRPYHCCYGFTVLIADVMALPFLSLLL